MSTQRKATEAKVRHRIDRLCERFRTYIQAFDRAKKFTGPSEYFHRRALAQGHGKNVAELLGDRSFLEYVYATLASWGMHRMGPRGAKMAPFEEFAQSLKASRECLDRVGRWSILSVNDQQTESVWAAVSAPRVSVTNTILVANSKVLHHILPALIPPMDRQYTLAFFGYRDIAGRDEQIFHDVYPKLSRIARRCRRSIEDAIDPTGWHTSFTKVLDNALVGFVLKEKIQKSV